jgi:hypothetical protein
MRLILDLCGSRIQRLRVVGRFVVGSRIDSPLMLEGAADSNADGVEWKFRWSISLTTN